MKNNGQICRTGARAGGVTIVELMIAVAISTILLLGVGTIYAASKRSYKIQEEFSRMQENARYALDFLARDVRMAGYQGCASLQWIVPNNLVDESQLPAGVDISFDSSTAITGHGDADANKNWVPTLLGAPANLVAGSDVLHVRRAGACSANLIGNYNANNANVQLSEACDFESGDVLFITDCETSDIFRGTTVGKGGGRITISHANNYNHDNFLSKIYKDDAQVMKYERNTYYIGTNDRNEPSLYARRFQMSGGNYSQVQSEIVENVEALRILYGVDTAGGNASADRFMTAEELHAMDPKLWGSVVSVRLALLMRTDEVGPGAKSYSFMGTTTDDPGDRRYRREFTTTVNIRSRTP